MSQAKEMITINARIDIAAYSLQTIVANAKKISGSDQKGIYRIDTAEKVNEMVSSFLKKYHFEEYVNDIDNYNR